MARKDEAAAWLEKGYSPAAIADEMGISYKSVMQYLFTKVEEGKIRRSDIVLTIDPRLREAAEGLLEKGKKVCHDAVKNVIGPDVSSADLECYMLLRDARISLGDMYEHISTIEIELHNLIRYVLIQQFGEENWWQDGVPLGIRKQCASLREEDDDPVPSYHYTTFIQLGKILEENWPLFQDHLPKEFHANRKQFLKLLSRMNMIRNLVMHPVKKQVI